MYFKVSYRPWYKARKQAGGELAISLLRGSRVVRSGRAKAGRPRSRTEVTNCWDRLLYGLLRVYGKFADTFKFYRCLRSLRVSFLSIAFAFATDSALTPR